MRRASLLAAVLLALAVGGWFGWSWYGGRNLLLSQPPERGASDGAPAVRASVVAANLRVPFSVLTSYLDKLSDQLSNPLEGSQDITCPRIDKPIIGGVWWRECLTVHWHVTPGRNGGIALSRHADKLHIIVPAKVSGGAGFGGAIAGILSLGNKTFDGSFIAAAEASIALDERFCPVVTIGDVNFDWKNVLELELVGDNHIEPIPGFKIGIGPWKLPIGQLLTGPLRSALKDGLQKAASTLPCDQVRTQIAKLWRTYSVPVALPGTPAFILAKPTSLSSPGVTVEDAALRLDARLAADVQVSTKAGPETSLGDLPPNRPTPNQPGHLSLAVSVLVSYEDLTSAARITLGGKTYDAALGSGAARISVRDIDIYPSGDRVAVGVDISASIPGRIFDVNGKIWLTAKPVVDATGTRVGLSNVALSRQLDNPAWSAFTMVAAGELAQQVQAKASYDLTPSIAKAKQALADALQDPSKTGGIRIVLTDSTLALGRIAVAKEGMFAEGLLSGGLSAQLETIPGAVR
jgi:hypothetical protein